MTSDWAKKKAKALAEAWYQMLGAWPSLHAVILAVAVATHETRCGDAWTIRWSDPAHPSGNWGASTLRKLNAAECSAIADAALDLIHAADIRVSAGLVLEFDGMAFHWRDPKTNGTHPLSSAERQAVLALTPWVGRGHEARAAAAQKAIRDAGLPLPPADIHCDSFTTQAGLRPYFVWFATFEEDRDGARYFLRILLGANGGRRARYVLDSAGGTARELAAAMYAAGYFWGFHKHDHGGPGDAANIDDYARAVDALAPGLALALGDWKPDGLDVPPAPPARLPLSRGMHGQDVADMQSIVGTDNDGDFGKDTEAAVKEWRRAHALPPTGQWDQACVDALATKPPDAEPMPTRLNLVQLQPDWAATRGERNQMIEDQGGI